MSDEKDLTANGRFPLGGRPLIMRDSRPSGSGGFIGESKPLTGEKMEGLQQTKVQFERCAVQRYLEGPLVPSDLPVLEAMKQKDAEIEKEYEEYTSLRYALSDSESVPDNLLARFNELEAKFGLPNDDAPEITIEQAVAVLQKGLQKDIYLRSRWTDSVMTAIYDELNSMDGRGICITSIETRALIAKQAADRFIGKLTRGFDEGLDGK